jgi:hypothetical protein
VGFRNSAIGIEWQWQPRRIVADSALNRYRAKLTELATELKKQGIELDMSKSYRALCDGLFASCSCILAHILHYHAIRNPSIQSAWDESFSMFPSLLTPSCSIRSYSIFIASKFGFITPFGPLITKSLDVLPFLSFEKKATTAPF